METFFYIISAALALGVLVFIHEWGHYWMAKKVGMKVEVFSIGFGKPIKKWQRGEVQWQIGWLPFGGYVKIAGMELGKGAASLTEEEKGRAFYAKTPWDRIKVALAGPFINILFALVIFTLIWACGGRLKPFSEYTHTIGWVDPESQLFEEGIRPGDLLSSYDGHPYICSKDLIYAAMFGSTTQGVELKGMRVDEWSHTESPFDVSVKPYRYPGAVEGLKTVGILSPARYLIYDRLPSGEENPLPEGSPLAGSGLQYQDRLLWLNGDILYSLDQLSYLINHPTALLTIQRQGRTLIARVPRLKVGEMRLDVEQRAELLDWQHDNQLKPKLPFLYFIPYNVSSDCVVGRPLNFIDSDGKQEAFPKFLLSPQVEVRLQPGDRILAVNGRAITHGRELLPELQEQKALLIVQRGVEAARPISWVRADGQYEKTIDESTLLAMVETIGTAGEIQALNHLVLLKPVTPKALLDFSMSPEQKAWMSNELLDRRKTIEAISDPEAKSQALTALDEGVSKKLLGVTLQDRTVVYNPSPLSLFGHTFTETYRTLGALIKGHLSPKWVSGPLGIVQVMQHSWSIGPLEALFWIGAFSLNLGLLNLIPIPVLDGGYVCLSVVELLLGRPLKSKTVERLILPFMVLLILFMLFVTYHDILRFF